MNEKIRILIAEDEPVILRCVKSAVMEIGDSFEVIAAAYNGKEAMALALLEKPDIIITDIMMPLLTGIELAQALREKGEAVHMILLTGYESFEYARQAMKYGVTDYLLKPVDFKQLKSCLEEAAEKIRSKKRTDIMSYVREAYLSGKNQENTTLEETFKEYIIYAYWGVAGKSEYDNLHITNEIFPRLSFGFVEELEKEYGCMLDYFKGPGANAYTFLLVTPKGKTAAIPLIAEKILHMLSQEKVFINIFVSKKIQDMKCQQEVIREMQVLVCSSMIFGVSRIYFWEQMQSVLPTQPSLHVKNFISCCEKVMDSSEVKAHIHSMICEWKEQGASHLTIQNDLRFLIGQLLQKSPVLNGRTPDIWEILYYSYSYESLEERILLELQFLFRLEEAVKAKENKGEILALEVKRYLDRHFMEQISFAELSRSYGYHEHYVTSVFRENIGKSPSKYVLEKRMELSKKLLAQEKEVLLKDVAEAVGYEDALYFSRVFKSSVGMSPSSYVKQCHKIKD